MRLSNKGDQINQFARMQKVELDAAVDETLDILKQQLEIVQNMVKKAVLAKAQLQEANSKEPTKFQTFKAAGGTIDDFFKGLEDRIGKILQSYYSTQQSHDYSIRSSKSGLQKSDVCRAYYARWMQCRFHNWKLQNNHPAQQRMGLRHRR